jgi:ADP-ribose pyrophosphatase YjhB (NUDIX family)
VAFLKEKYICDFIERAIRKILFSSFYADKNGQSSDVAFLKEKYICDFIERAIRKILFSSFYVVLIAYLNIKQKAWK